MEIGSKERLDRHNRLEDDIMSLLKGDGVDIQMAITAMEVLSYNVDQKVRDFLVSHSAKEVLDG